jgi:hypothetical protein
LKMSYARRGGWFHLGHTFGHEFTLAVGVQFRKESQGSNYNIQAVSCLFIFCHGGG